MVFLRPMTTWSPCGGAASSTRMTHSDSMRASRGSWDDLSKSPHHDRPRSCHAGKCKAPACRLLLISSSASASSRNTATSSGTHPTGPPQRPVGDLARRRVGSYHLIEFAREALRGHQKRPSTLPDALTPDRDADPRPGARSTNVPDETGPSGRLAEQMRRAETPVYSPG